MTEMNPLQVALILERSSSRDLPRDPKTGLYTADGSEPATDLTLAQYEAGLKVLDLRDRVSARR